MKTGEKVLMHTIKQLKKVKKAPLPCDCKSQYKC